jgi:hypothetical protein
MRAATGGDFEIGSNDNADDLGEAETDERFHVSADPQRVARVVASFAQLELDALEKAFRGLPSQLTGDDGDEFWEEFAEHFKQFAKLYRDAAKRGMGVLITLG